MSLLKILYSNSNMNYKIKVKILNILGNIFKLDSNDSSLLNLYRTKTIISKYWDIDTSSIRIGNTDARLELIENLLVKSSNVDEFLAITELTKSWNEFNEGNLCNNIWLSICLKIIEKLEKNSSKYIVNILDGVKINVEVTINCILMHRIKLMLYYIYLYYVKGDQQNF